MIVSNRRFLFMLMVPMLLLAACAPVSDNDPTGASLHVTVSVLPQRYFVQRIGGEYFDVMVMVEPGASPHTYEPKPAQMRELSQSDAYMRVGVGFEDAWMTRIADANRDMVIVDTAEGIERLPLEAHEHDDDDDEDHDEEGLDPHIWLSPRLVKIQAQNIHRALVTLDPEQEAVYTANLEAFSEDIDALDVEIRAKLDDLENRKFIVFHPSWGYFAYDYDLEQVPIEVSGLEPGPADLARLITEAREENIRVVIAQPEFSTQAAQTIADEIDGHVELISPLPEDWLEEMRHMADVFASVLGE